MKCISLWQPWSSAIALGSKRIETRGWSTKYRGPLAIHAAKRMVKSEMLDIQRSQVWQSALIDAYKGDIRFWWEVLPFGQIVATCELVDCRPSESFEASVLDRVRRADIGGWTERDMGNFTAGRFGWVLDKVVPLATPIPFKGLQGLFNVPDELVLNF